MSGAKSSQPSLAIAMIVRNAAAALRETLQSTGGLAAKVVLLDTGSTDDTIQVAQQCGASIRKRPWNDDFAAARNALLDEINADWVLWLDAGERLTPDSVAALRTALHGPLDLQRAYLLPIVLPAAPGQLGGEQVWQVRLHPNLQAVRFAGRVRESLDESLLAAGIAVEPLDVPIHRTTRDLEPTLRATRAQRNVRLADLAIAESGPTAAMHNCQGESLQILGDPLRAAHHYHQALKLAEPASREALEAHYGLLTCLDSAGPDRQLQLSLCMRALERFSLDAQLLVALGGYLRSLGHLPLAIRSFDVALRHGQTELRLWHLLEIREIAAACAAAAHDQNGDGEAARTLLEAAVRMFPHSLKLGRQLAELHLKEGRRSDAQRVVAALPLDEQQRQEWQNRLLRCDPPAAEAASPISSEATRTKPATQTAFSHPAN